jgi:hypothetical protein
MRRLCTVVVAALVLCMAVPASAQRREVERLVNEAKAAFDEGQFSDAATLLQEAYDIEPVPFFIWNTARAYEKAGLWELAELNYLRYSELEITEEEKALAADRIARHQASRELSKSLRSARSGAELDTLRASNRQLRDKAGGDDTQEPVPQGGGGGAGIWELAGWGGVGLGVICLGVASTLQLASVDTVEEYNAAANGGDRAKYDALHDTLQTRVATSQVLWISGVIFAAAGGTILYFEYFDGSAESEGPAARLVPLLSSEGGGFALEGRF